MPAPRFRLSPFLLKVTLIPSVWYLYLAIQLISHTEAALPVRLLLYAALAVPYFLMAWLPFVYWDYDEPAPSAHHDRMLWGAYLSIGLLSFLFLFVLARDVLAMASLAAEKFFPMILLPGAETLYGGYAGSGILAGAASCVVLGMVFARRTPAVVRVKIPVQGLPGALEGFRIVQISDLHVGSTIRRDFVERVVAQANGLRPDLIALTGDLVDGTPTQLRSHTEPLTRLEARHGRFYVTGNHEYYWDVADWLREAARLGFIPLVNEHRVVEHGGARLVIAGVPDHWASRYPDAVASSPAAALQGAPPEAAVRILLAHQPQTAHAAAKAGYDLQLSGHTHGGQFFPWTLVIHLLQPFVSGLNRCGEMQVYVNQGTGYWGPPIRLGAASEITLLELTRAP